MRNLEASILFAALAAFVVIAALSGVWMKPKPKTEAKPNQPNITVIVPPQPPSLAPAPEPERAPEHRFYRL